RQSPVAHPRRQEHPLRVCAQTGQVPDGPAAQAGKRGAVKLRVFPLYFGSLMADATRIPDSVTLPELTLRGVLLGALITVIFTASNVFLGLKVGLTFSSAIPA